jgi:hypothetical protein
MDRAKRWIVFGTALVALMACALISTLFVLNAGLDAGQDPKFVGHCYGPDATLSAFIRDAGGLPKESTDIASDPDGVKPTTVYSVTSWSVDGVRVRRVQSLFHDLFDDDPAYQTIGDVHVYYADGDERTLRWRSWRYGLLLGSTVLCSGDGPPGRVEVIEANAK